jgi:AcrR family transcriptional regulator
MMAPAASAHCADTLAITLFEAFRNVHESAIHALGLRQGAYLASKKKSGGPPRRKRKRGRPQAAEQGLGRDGIIAAARSLLETLHPHRVTIVMIARKAGVDPALVRYYFASREELFLAVAENILATWMTAHPSPQGTAAEKLATTVTQMVDFALSARSMQRLMLEECVEAKSPQVRQRILDLHASGVQRYARLFDTKESEPLDPVDPLFAYIAIIGMCEFFAAAQSVIVPLLPQRLSAEKLADSYKRFLVKLVLDGLRPRP